MKLIIFSLFLIVVLIEIVFAGEKIRTGISPKAKLLLRTLLGLLYNLIYIFIEVPDLFHHLFLQHSVFMIYPDQFEQLGYLNLFLVFGYWTLFDGGLNLYRKINWFTWGRTKKIDRFFSTGGFPVIHIKFMIGHLLKWTGTLGGFVGFFLPY